MITSSRVRRARLARHSARADAVHRNLRKCVAESRACKRSSTKLSATAPCAAAPRELAIARSQLEFAQHRARPGLRLQSQGAFGQSRAQRARGRSCSSPAHERAAFTRPATQTAMATRIRSDKCPDQAGELQRLSKTTTVARRRDTDARRHRRHGRSVRARTPRTRTPTSTTDGCPEPGQRFGRLAGRGRQVPARSRRTWTATKTRTAAPIRTTTRTRSGRQGSVPERDRLDDPGAARLPRPTVSRCVTDCEVKITQQITSSSTRTRSARRASRCSMPWQTCSPRTRRSRSRSRVTPTTKVPPPTTRTYPNRRAQSVMKYLTAHGVD